MTRQILPIAALLMGSAFLLFAGGINALLLPVRGTAEGFGSFSLGLLGTGWALGYVLGCILTPGLVARVGHIRSFSVMAAIAGVAVLLSLLLISPWAWVPLRAMSGFCFSGAAMIVEGWLSERSDTKTRGTIFGVYTMINLLATTAGQMILTLGDPLGHVFFVLAAIFYLLALIPTAVSSSATPKPLVQARLDLRRLYRNSPVAVVSSFLIGVSNGTFATLAAVYATRIGLDLKSVALFTSLPILAGAVAQIPAGMVSDRIDRRVVLLVIALVAIAADAAFIAARPDDTFVALVAVSILGAAIFTIYPLLVAHANDHASPGDYVLTSAGLLLVFGIGAIVGPLIAGIAMETVGPRGLFLTTVAAHIAIACYTVVRIATSSAPPTEEKANFLARSLTRTTTPQTSELAPAPESVGETVKAD